MPADFSHFDWDRAKLLNRRHLPHLQQPGAIYFVTFRLADSLPVGKVRQWKHEREQWLVTNPPPHTEDQLRALRQLVPLRIHQYLDAGHGSCVLNCPAARQTVEDVLRHGDCDSGLASYRLGDFAIMPNHVHALVQPAHSALRDIIAAWKSISARRINSNIHRQGQLWQKESFDHIIRDPQKLETARKYIRNNPARLRPDTYTLSRGTLQ